MKGRRGLRRCERRLCHCELCVSVARRGLCEFEDEEMTERGGAMKEESLLKNRRRP